MTNLILVALGGAFGASLRYLTSLLFKYFFYHSFIGTLFVNVLGCFLIGYMINTIQSKNLSERQRKIPKTREDIQFYMKNNQKSKNNQDLPIRC